MHSLTGAKTIHLDLTAALSGDDRVLDSDLLDWEHLVPTAAIAEAKRDGYQVACGPAGCLLTFAGSEGRNQHIVVSVPASDGLVDVEVVVGAAAQDAINRLMTTFEAAAEAVLVHTIAEPGDCVQVNGYGHRGPGTVDLVILDAGERVVFKESCRRDIDCVFKAIKTGRRKHFTA